MPIPLNFIQVVVGAAIGIATALFIYYSVKESNLYHRPYGYRKKKRPNDSDCCIICFERDSNTILEPCGHDSCCSVCIQKIATPYCPLCREKIKRVMVL